MAFVREPLNPGSETNHTEPPTGRPTFSSRFPGSSVPGQNQSGLSLSTGGVHMIRTTFETGLYCLDVIVSMPTSNTNGCR